LRITDAETPVFFGVSLSASLQEIARNTGYSASKIQDRNFYPWLFLARAQRLPDIQRTEKQYDFLA
jgi:hypothetical protein